MAVSMAGLLSIIMWLIIIGGIAWLLWWLVSYIGLPAPFDKVARVIIAVVAVFLLINLLLGLVGEPIVRLR